MRPSEEHDQSISMDDDKDGGRKHSGKSNFNPNTDQSSSLIQQDGAGTDDGTGTDAGAGGLIHDDTFVDNIHTSHQPDSNGNITYGSDSDPSVVISNNINSSQSLDYHIKILYVLTGLIEVVPNLAILSLINDRIKLPTQYIPPYYAIEFLPYSLKPLYALVTYWLTVGAQHKALDSESNSRSNLNSYFEEEGGGRRISTNATGDEETKCNMKIQKHWLLASLQLCASLSIGLTAFLPPNAIIPCFIMGFLRGFTVSWAEFLNGLALISSVRQRQLSNSLVYSVTSTPASALPMDSYNDDNIESDDQGIFHNDNNYARKNRRNEEEMLLSLFQSSAATYRNIGASIGEIIVLSIILGRKYFTSSDETGEAGSGSGSGALSDSFVTMMLLASATIPLTASFVALKGKVGTSGSRHCHYYGRHRYTEAHSQQQEQQQEQNDSNDNHMNSNNTRNSQRRRRGYNPVSLEHESMHSPTSILRTSSSSHSVNKGHTRHVRRVGLYLILRHAMPSSIGLIASYEYTIFRTRPLYLQLKSFLLSITAVLSTWTYSRLISKKYASIKDISRAIIAATIVISIWSMMFLPFYEIFRQGSAGVASGGPDTSLGNANHMMRTATVAVATGGTSINSENANSTSTSSIGDNDYYDGSDDDSISFNGSMLLLVSFAMYQLIGSFLSEISFLPSVVLATNTVVHSDDTNETTAPNENDNRNGSNDESGGNGDQSNSASHDYRGNNNDRDNIYDEDNEDTGDSFDQHRTKKPWYLDDGILYGIMISCIDFGDQLGAWFAAPLVRMLNITRENNWDNLNWFVVICSLASIASLGFLRVMWHRSKPVDR